MVSLKGSLKVIACPRVIMTQNIHACIHTTKQVKNQLFTLTTADRIS